MDQEDAWAHLIVCPLYGRLKFQELFRLDAYTLTQQRRNNSWNFTLPYKGRTPLKRNSEATLQESSFAKKVTFYGRVPSSSFTTSLRRTPSPEGRRWGGIVPPHKAVASRPLVVGLNHHNLDPQALHLSCWRQGDLRKWNERSELRWGSRHRNET